MGRPILHSKHSYPTGQHLQMTHQQVLRAGHMGTTHPYQLRHGGLLHLKHLHGVNRRLIHGGCLGRPVVHGERRPHHLMALHKRHTPLGRNNHNDLHLNRVYPSIRILDSPSPQDGLVLGTKEYAVVDRRRRLIPPCDDPTHKDLQIASYRCSGPPPRLVVTSNIRIMQIPSTLRTWRGVRGIGVQTLMPELVLLRISHEWEKQGQMSKVRQLCSRYATTFDKLVHYRIYRSNSTNPPSSFTSCPKPATGLPRSTRPPPRTRIHRIP